MDRSIGIPIKGTEAEPETELTETDVTITLSPDGPHQELTSELHN